MNRRKPTLAAIGALLFVLACTADDPFDLDFDPPVPAATMLAAVSGDGQVGAVAASLDSALVVRVLDQYGQPLQGAAVAWSVVAGAGTLSESPTETDADGLTSVIWTLGDSLGAQLVVATALPATGNVPFVATAVPGSPETVQVTPDTLRFDALGDTASASVSAQDAFGNAIEDPPITWSSANVTRASVNAAGRVTAQGPGTTRVVASSGDAADTVVVIIEQAAAIVLLEPDADTLVSAGDSAQLRASVHDRNGRRIADAEPTWSSADSAIATVDSIGFVHAVDAGTVEIYATYDSVADTTSITVLIPDSIFVTTEADTLMALGDTTRLVAIVTDSAGDTITGGRVTWSTLDTLVARVDIYGRVTAIDTGSTSIVAAIDALRDSASIVVAPDTTTPDTATTSAEHRAARPDRTEGSLREQARAAPPSSSDVTPPAASAARVVAYGTVSRERRRGRRQR